MISGHSIRAAECIANIGKNRSGRIGHVKKDTDMAGKIIVVTGNGKGKTTLCPGFMH